MNCPNCGIKNPEEANFCRECSFSLKEEMVFDTISFKRVRNPAIKIFLWIFLGSIIIGVPIFMSAYTKYEESSKKFWSKYEKEGENRHAWLLDSTEAKNLRENLRGDEDYVYSLIAIPIIMILFIVVNKVVFLIFNLRRKRFELLMPYDKIKGKVKKL